MDLQPYVMQDKEGLCFDWFRQPFTLVDIKASVWNVATDRVWFVARRGKGEYPRWKGDAEGFNVMISLIQAVPVDPHEVVVEELSEWVAKGDLGRILDVVVSLDRVKELLKLVRSERVLAWNAAPVLRGLPCLALVLDRLKLFLMGHGEVSSDAKITPIDVNVLTRCPKKVVDQDDSREHEGFNLAMALVDSE